ncbi:crossover junction endodeoxyribonuclease RuvC [Boudabousia liubingyangii]|uniref:Crossover junction endodeoxyribonuclease RuvC n=1 Tax=Boudabousia liubingyangii TaxID=1921764 RepID=A0A1Q5PNK2_9ACTO|nr:crossover junction endodeoxyribonuclease RuvC [Boudabousia liubingyangii]OKL47722.1 crossover junction endodeoxyribonuclease RuvC [Boudabousia liubingyangii]OKL49148.1 crossover junction endodeoxyribonuclease RuvC [Boudabousia liubingyangii]
MRILGIDPGLTRCGVGVIDVDAARQARLVFVGVIRSDTSQATHFRLRDIMRGLNEVIAEQKPDMAAIERVFVQDNLQSVTTTMMVMGTAMATLGEAGLPLAVHTPSEVKAAVTGNGKAGKAQVQAMVQRILKLSAPPKPADAADALAIAICQAWRGSGILGATADEDFTVSLSGKVSSRKQLTPAQAQWAAAQAKLRRTGAVAPKGK